MSKQIQQLQSQLQRLSFHQQKEDSIPQVLTNQVPKLSHTSPRATPPQPPRFYSPPQLSSPQHPQGQPVPPRVYPTLTPRNAPVQDQQLQPPQETISSAMTKLAHFYKTDKQRFGGALDEDWNKTLKRFEQFANKFFLPNHIRAQCLQLVFRDDAETFFLNELEQYHDNYTAMVQLLNERYNSAPRKRAMLDEISKMTISEFTAAEKTEASALAALARRIERIVPQLDPPHNNDRAKREVLRSALMNTPWAQIPIYNLMHSTSQSKIYKQFFDELVAAEHQHRIFSDNSTTTPTQKPKSKQSTQKPTLSKLGQSEAEIWYQGQARYGRDRNATKRRYINNSSRSLTCFNCGKSGHAVSKCRLPKDEVRIVKARMRQILRGKSKDEQVKLLKALLGEHAAHVNYLSDMLADSLTHHGITEIPDEDDTDAMEEMLTLMNESEEIIDDQELSPEESDLKFEPSAVCHILSESRDLNTTPEPHDYSILFTSTYYSENYSETPPATSQPVLISYNSTPNSTPWSDYFDDNDNFYHPTTTTTTSSLTALPSSQNYPNHLTQFTSTKKALIEYGQATPNQATTSSISNHTRSPSPSSQPHTTFHQDFIDDMFEKHEHQRQKFSTSPPHKLMHNPQLTPQTIQNDILHTSLPKKRRLRTPKDPIITELPTTAQQFHNHATDKFHGACLDIGAQRTCIGIKQARALTSKQGIKLKLTPSPFVFKFGDVKHHSLGKMNIRIPTPNTGFLEIQADVVSADVPLLIGIDTLDKFKLVADNVRNILECRTQQWSLPITRLHGHMYITWDPCTVLFTRNELKRIHKHMWHPSASKLYNILKRTHPKDTTCDTLKILEEISAACSTCTTLSRNPHRFRVTLPKDRCIFNHELAIDLVWLKKKPVLHVVDTHTNFSAAIFLPSKSTKDIW